MWRVTGRRTEKDGVATGGDDEGSPLNTLKDAKKEEERREKREKKRRKDRKKFNL